MEDHLRGAIIVPTTFPTEFPHPANPGPGGYLSLPPPIDFPGASDSLSFVPFCVFCMLNSFSVVFHFIPVFNLTFFDTFNSFSPFLLTAYRLLKPISIPSFPLHSY